MEKEARIDWVDVYKGMAICLMVVGHVTGKFNQYIYQFHMAAFFFISGYTVNSKNRNVVRIIWDRCYTMLLPYISVFTGMIFVEAICNRLGILNHLFTEDMVYIGFWESFRQFFLYGNCYAWWLGAGWFITELFIIEVIHEIFVSVTQKNIGWYVICVSICYHFGYFLVAEGSHLRIGFFSFDLALIGIGFFGAGYIVRKSRLLQKIDSVRWMIFIFFVIHMMVFYFLGNRIPNVVNYPTRSFNTPFIDFIAGINGAAFLIILARVFSKTKYIKWMLVYLGRNTLGILFFHFQFFKVGYLVLVFFRIVPAGYIQYFLPTEEIALSWWWMIAAVSVIFSLLEWKCLTTIWGIRFFFGKEKGIMDGIYTKIQGWMKRNVLKQNRFLLADFSVNVKSELKKSWFLLGICVVLAFCIPFWNQGIMCNDELQYQFWARQGFLIAYKQFRAGWIAQGRFLASIFTPIWTWLSVIGIKTYIYRMLPVASIVLNVILFGKLINRLFEDKQFSLFCSIAILAFLPVSFAPMAPNAYTTDFGIPFSILLYAMILYVDNLEYRRKRRMLLVSFLMFVAFTSYEIFVTYVPLFCIFSLWKKGLENKKEILKDCVCPVFTGVFYIMAYLLCRLWMPSNYAGNHIGFTVSGAVRILVYLAKVSFPGYFLTSPTYQYLNSIYHNLQLLDYLRMLTAAGGLLAITYQLADRGRKNKMNCVSKRKNIWILMIAAAYTMIPALPLSIASMYQGNIGENMGFIALPVTYFTYFAATFLCCFILWKLLKKCSREWMLVPLFLIICIICLPVQYMNSNFSQVQNRNYERIREIEKFFMSDTVIGLKGAKVYSSDIFKTELSLGIHSSYWQDTVSMLGGDIQIIQDTQVPLLKQETYWLSYVDDLYFVLEGENEIYLALTEIKSEKNIELADGSLRKIKLENPVPDHGYYMYQVSK